MSDGKHISCDAALRTQLGVWGYYGDQELQGLHEWAGMKDDCTCRCTDMALLDGGSVIRHMVGWQLGVGMVFGSESGKGYGCAER